jgi:hypothetical protein
VASKHSKASKQSKAQQRQERLRELQKEQKRAERRRNLMIFGVTGIVALAIIGGTAYGIINQKDDDGGNSIETSGTSQLEPDPSVGIKGVESAEITDQTHTPEDVAYPDSPPAGGPHNPAWQTCGFYSEPIEDENGVHSLEHGAVWITYSPDLDSADVDTLKSEATPGGYVLVSPRDQLPSPIVATAWGYQLQLDSADDPRLEQFLDKFVQGPQTLEPGATCSNGIGEPETGE